METRPSLICFTEALDAKALEEFALKLEELDYDSLWVPELFGREPFATVSYLLARTTRLHVATGIANVYSHNAIVAAQARRTLAELSGGRFALGLGVSHPPMAAIHGLEWLPPARKMRTYLDTLEATEVRSPSPAAAAPVWLAAHGPALLRLAAKRADGANTYLMPPEHTRQAREILGADKRLNVVVPSCLCDDASVGRRVGRKAISLYLPLPAYRKQWRSWGFDDSDFEDGGSDRLVDMAVAWGNETKIRDRLDAYLAAGASHIAISPMNAEGRGPAWKLIEAIAR